jgi:hypothetical protein
MSARILMLALKVTMQTWKWHWELQSHNFLEDESIGASINYLEMFCCIIGIRVKERIWGLSQIRSKNDLKLTLYFMWGISQKDLWLFQRMIVDMQLSLLWNIKMWITRSTIQNLSGAIVNVFSHKRETYVNIKLKY